MTSTADQFFQASYKGDLESVRRLLADEPDLAKSRGSAAWDGATPLTLAALGGHLETARLLIERGASVNPMSDDGSALLMAAWGGHEPMVQLLLQAGADVNLASASGETPLMAAAYKGFAAIAELLLGHGADVNAQTSRGTTDFVNISPPVCGESALHLAAAEGHRRVVELLLTHGASKTLADHCGQRPLHWAARHHRDELFPLLK
jgi:ankyrin repeat protein